MCVSTSVVGDYTVYVCLQCGRGLHSVCLPVCVSASVVGDYTVCTSVVRDYTVCTSVVRDSKDVYEELDSVWVWLHVVPMFIEE